MAKRYLKKAKEKKQNEFYTLLSDIENELSHYQKHFDNKIVYCNCDDPFESNFFKYFVLNFERLNLKKLICTSYAGSPIVCKKLRMCKSNLKDACRKAWKIEIDKIQKQQDGGFDIQNSNFMEYVKKHATLLKGDGDFRSEECIDLLKRADIVVTNPPFSLFREYIAQLMDYDKKFIILGNMNAITYKEVFKFIKDNKLWCGYGFNMSLVYKTPYENKLEANQKFVIQKGYDPKTHIKVPAVNWYTNLEHSKRNEFIDLFKSYKKNKDLYREYFNFKAINVDNIKNIPFDYEGYIGVPITFLGAYNPKQFDIIGLGISNSGISIGVKPYLPEHKTYRKTVQKKGAVDGDLYMLDKNKHPDVPYARIIIKRKK